MTLWHLLAEWLCPLIPLPCLCFCYLHCFRIQGQWRSWSKNVMHTALMLSLSLCVCVYVCICVFLCACMSISYAYRIRTGLLMFQGWGARLPSSRNTTCYSWYERSCIINVRILLHIQRGSNHVNIKDAAQSQPARQSADRNASSTLCDRCMAWLGLERQSRNSSVYTDVCVFSYMNLIYCTPTAIYDITVCVDGGLLQYAFNPVGKMCCSKTFSVVYWLWITAWFLHKSY
jgi:hypothetical protein